MSRRLKLWIGWSPAGLAAVAEESVLRIMAVSLLPWLARLVASGACAWCRDRGRSGSRTGKVAGRAPPGIIR